MNIFQPIGAPDLTTERAALEAAHDEAAAIGAAIGRATTRLAVIETELMPHRRALAEGVRLRVLSSWRG